MYTSTLFLCHFYVHADIVQLSTNKSLCVTIWHLVLACYFSTKINIEIYIMYCHSAKNIRRYGFCSTSPSPTSSAKSVLCSSRRPVAVQQICSNNIRLFFPGAENWTHKNLRDVGVNNKLSLEGRCVILGKGPCRLSSWALLRLDWTLETAGQGKRNCRECLCVFLRFLACMVASMIVCLCFQNLKYSDADQSF